MPMIIFDFSFLIFNWHTRKVLFPAPQLPGSPPRVVVTGAGIVTALGMGWDTNAEGFRQGRCAIGPVTLFDVSRQRVKNAGEVTLPSGLPRNQLGRRREDRLDRATKLLLLAAHEAWNQSGWSPSNDLPVVLGTTSGGMSLGEEYYRQALKTPNVHRRQATRVI